MPPHNLSILGLYKHLSLDSETFPQEAGVLPTLQRKKLREMNFPRVSKLMGHGADFQTQGWLLRPVIVFLT